VLFHAISITTHPTRPLRELPRLQYVRTVRRSLYLLYWRLQAHYTAVLGEYRLRQKERRAMYLQDLFSHMVEIVALGDRKRLEAEQRDYEARLARDREDEMKRQARSEHMLLVDYKSRAAAEAKREAERAVQRAYKQKLALLASQQKVLDDIAKEMEFMRVEEIVTRNYVNDWKSHVEKRALLQQQAQLVERAKLAGVALYGEKGAMSKTVLGTQLQRLVPRIAPRKNRLLPPPPSAGELGMVKYKEQKQLQFLHGVAQLHQYLRTLPLDASYVANVCESLAGSMDEIVFPAVATSKEGKKQSAAMKAAAAAALALPTVTDLWQQQRTLLEESDASQPAVMLSDGPELDTAFLEHRLRGHADVSAVLHPVRTVISMRPIELQAPVVIKGMLSRPQLVQLLGEEGQAMSIAQQQYNMRLQCALAVDDTSVSKMRLLLQLRRARQVRARGYQHLVTEHAAFKQALAALHAKRTQIHATKYPTRQARKVALQEAAVIEAKVLELRHSVVRICTSFYSSFYDEVELFLTLFYPVEVKGEDVHTAEDDKHDKIVSKKILFDASHPEAVSYHATSEVELQQKASELAQRSNNTSTGKGPAATEGALVQPKLGRRSSRIDAVYIAPKKKEQQASTPKGFRNKRESVVYAGSTAKKAHVTDPFHALHQVPIDKTLQHRLATTRKPVDRLLMYQDYWATVHLDMQYYHVSPLDLVGLPAAPIPTFHNDGTPHILKYSQTGASKRINASHVHKHFDAQHMSIVEKLKLKEAQLKQQKMMKKEIKLHDIPGFNLFQDADDQEYDFSVWAEKVIIWCKELNGWFRQREAGWRKHHRAQALTYLLRLQYLVDGGDGANHHGTHDNNHNNNPSEGEEEGHLDEKHIKASNALVRKKLLAKLQQQQEEQRRRKRSSRTWEADEARRIRGVQAQLQEQNSLFLLRQLDTADVLDVFEVLLCRSNIGLKVTYHSIHALPLCTRVCGDIGVRVACLAAAPSSCSSISSTRCCSLCLVGLLLSQVAGAEQKGVFTRVLTETAASASTVSAGSTVAEESNLTQQGSSSGLKTADPSTTGTSSAPTSAAVSATISREPAATVRELHHSLSRLITADELDVTVAKHPASLTARFLLIQLALAQVGHQLIMLR
jgi:hypothetical protein